MLTLQPAQAASLIRCPDWQRYITPAAVIRTTPAKQSFDAALAATRAKNKRLAVKSQAGQVVPTGANDFALTTRANPAITTTRLSVSDARAGNTRSVLTKANRKDTNRKAQQTTGITASACQYTVRKGDTLSKIAAVHLGNSRRWPEIARANKLTGTLIPIGQTLLLPCAPGGQKTAQVPHPKRRKATVVVSTTLKLAPKPVPAKPLPVWTARPGEFVSDVIDRWAKRAGHTVVRDGVEEWKISVPVKIRGQFKHALDQLVVGFEGSGRPLAISVYANKVIRIGRPL